MTARRPQWLRHAVAWITSMWLGACATAWAASGAGMADDLATAATDIATDIAAGERLYREGLRADGTAVTAERLQGLQVRGREAACVHCHRPSGMGGAEGSQAVPSITGAILNEPGRPAATRSGRLAPGLQRQAPASATRPGYTPALLARALTQGLGAGGQALDALMPRYRLDERDLRQLAAYLDTLDTTAAPGLADGVLHLATIVTADTPADVQHASSDLLAACLSDRSPPQPDAGAQAAARPPSLPPPWQLHRWTLGADPSRWPTELAEWQRRQPVFALIGGASGADGRGPWQAVHRHCEAQGLPCILPNTVSVDDQLPSRWSVYFSRGVGLEASGMAEHLALHAPPSAAGQRRVHQIVQTNHEAATTASSALRRHLAPSGWPVIDHPADEPDTKRAAWLATLGRDDALLLWLDGAQLRRLSTRHPAPAAGALLLSGELTGLDTQALAPAWRPAARMAHAYEPAERQLPRLLRNAGKLLAGLGQEPAATPALLRLQGHSLSACEMTANALRRMGSRAGRAWFMELIESADEAAVATAYPRFTLGPGQRHGAQGIGLMRYASPDHQRLQPAGEWLTPP